MCTYYHNNIDIQIPHSLLQNTRLLFSALFPFNNRLLVLLFLVE